MRRATVVVMDACGVGALPDAEEYGDGGSNTLAHLAELVGGCELPTLERLGLGSIVPILGVAPASDPAVHGRLRPLGPGKESTTGHWELMGVVPSQRAARRIPIGFPPDGGRGAGGRHRACGSAATGRIQRHRGDRGLRRASPRDRRGDPVHVGRLGAADRDARRPRFRARAVRGVRGGAAGDDRRARGGPGDRAAVRGCAGSVPPDARAGTTTRCCRPAARICRSFRTPAWRCTASARSTTCSPASGSTSSTPARPTPPASPRRLQLLRELECGLIFVNLVETDQVYGHRHDVEGFHASADRDRQRGRASGSTLLRDDDLLILTADHGVDPTAPHTDHTREYAPLLAVYGGCAGVGTTACWPTWGRACCAGSPAGRRLPCRVSHSSEWPRWRIWFAQRRREPWEGLDESEEVAGLATAYGAGRVVRGGGARGAGRRGWCLGAGHIDAVGCVGAYRGGVSVHDGAPADLAGPWRRWRHRRQHVLPAGVLQRGPRRMHAERIPGRVGGGERRRSGRPLRRAGTDRAIPP